MLVTNFFGKKKDFTSGKLIRVLLSRNEELMDFYKGIESMMDVNTSDIDFFNTNPNDNAILNVDYYKSLHWYNWNLLFNYDGTDDEPCRVQIRNTYTKQSVFVF